MATDEYIDDQGEDVVAAPCVHVARSKQSMEERDDAPVHRELTLRQQLGKERGVRLEVWPAEVEP